MRLVTYRRIDGSTQVGELRDETLYSLDLPDKMRDLAETGEVPLDRIKPHKVMKHRGILPPITPGKILCVGRNYAEHANELGNELPKTPLIFAKFPSSIIGEGDTVRWHQSVTQQVDWEGELVVVIGKTARHIAEEDAYKHIFGYTIANDISARDIQDSESQWVRAKAQDTFCPLGPCIITRDEIEDPHDLRVRTVVNGETVQDGHTADMIFKIPFLVAYLSRTFTLEPGDLILTGTPSGVGKGMNPPRFLQDGDEVSVTIDPIGSLRNVCHADG